MAPPRPRLARSESLHQQVARNIRNDIEAGVLRDGDTLPSTRELADQWGVSVFTISEAMKLLTAEGLVVSKSRSKRIVQAPDQPAVHRIRLEKPHVVFVGGYAGSGKTELGRILARETGWPMLDKDTLTRPVVEAALEMLGKSPHDRESETYLQHIRPREYEALSAAATENVECGTSAIITAPFIREFNDGAWVNRTQAYFSSIGAITTLVWVYCDADTMRTYVRHRGAARDAGKISDWAAYMETVNLEFRPTAPYILVDNSASSRPLQEQAKELLKAVFSGQAES